MITILKWLFLWVLLAMLLVPAIQGRVHFSKEAGLDGAVTPAPRPEFSWAGLRAGTYQPALEQYLAEHLGFRPYLIRFRNQLLYSWFRVAKSHDIVVGLHRVLFQPAPIGSCLGHDRLPAAEVRFRVRRLRAVQRALARRGVELLFVLAPNKARYQPEDLPAQLRPAPGTVTNYDLFTQALRADSVNLLDMVPVFARWKATKPYPLFPRDGIHWSGYGATLAADTLLRQLELLGRLRFPTVRTVAPPRLVREAQGLRGTDNDLGWLLNLMYLPAPTPLAYRQLAFDPPRPGQTRPSALFVGDSFVWALMLVSPYMQREFADDTRFWYYNNAVHLPDSTYHDTGERVGSLDLRPQLESRKFVIVLVTEHNLVENEFGFTEQVYRLYHPLTATDQAAIDQLTRKLASAATWKEQTEDPEGFAQRIRQRAQDQYERQQLR
ncbi:alginate O-acetyltransferase AlgX-related protein [Hymenobacter daeguensis]